tara:strand:- start:8115 stop:9254 length:1140 start_codon:yes stop_codon:yes gene_type:complete
MNKSNEMNHIDKWIIKNNPGGSYIFDKEVLKKDLDFIKNELNDIKIAYSYKTNSYEGICKSLDSFGCLSEVVSPFELNCTKDFKIDCKKVIYNGPVKNKDSISYVLLNGGLVNADSPTDLELILKTIDELPQDKKYKVGLRLDLDIEETRFGINIKTKLFNKCIEKLLNKSNIIFECLHIHYPNRSLDSFILRINKFIDFLSTIKVKPNSIDIGGSLPSLLNPILSKQLNLKTNALKFHLKEIKAFHNNLINIGIKNLIIEPGTALVSNCFYLCGQVKSINIRDKYNVATLDISKMNLGNINSRIIYPFRLIKASYDNSEKKYNYKICGYTCIENDLLCSKRLSKLSLGDYLLFEASGSYSYAFDNFFINPPLKVLDLY